MLPLGICNKKISFFVSPLHTYKETKHCQHLQAVRKNHESICQKIWWHTFKILKFRQPSTSHHPISSTLLSRWPDSSWIHWHLIIMHKFNMVCTFFGMSISSFKRLWSISWKIWCFFLTFQTKNVQQQASCELFIKDHVQLLCTLLNSCN